MLSNVQVNVWKHTSRHVISIRHTYGWMTVFIFHVTCAEHNKLLILYHIYQLSTTLEHSHEKITLTQSYSFYSLRNSLHWCVVRNHWKFKYNIDRYRCSGMYMYNIIRYYTIIRKNIIISLPNGLYTAKM